MAGYIPEDKIAEIKNAAEILEVIGESVQLKKAGRNYIGLCPFHSEKTPSFSVSPEKQIFHCFGCGTGGNVVTFLMKHDGLSFPEALKLLADRYGITIPETSVHSDKDGFNVRQRLLEINAMALEYFQSVLRHPEAGSPARAYLAKRGFTLQTIDAFQLGYAPAGWEFMVRFLTRKKVPLKDAVTAGLIAPRKKGRGYYDRFRERIIFPILDANRQTIGFGGRVLDDSLPKYLNSPETPLYNKSRSLYGLHLAKSKCRQQNAVFIVEGYFDLLALHQHGIENAVATLGTALTAEQIRRLRGYARQFFLVFDSDAAGVQAAQRGVARFLKNEIEAHILMLPRGDDPDSFVFRQGAATFHKAAEGALGVIPFLIQSAREKHGLSTQGRMHMIADLQTSLLEISDPVQRAVFIKEIAETTGIDESAIHAKIRQTESLQNTSERRRETRRSGSAPPPSSAEALPKVLRLEAQIIAMMLQCPDILCEVQRRKTIEQFESQDLRTVGMRILERAASFLNDVSCEAPPLGIDDIMIDFQDSALGRPLAKLLMADEDWSREGCMRLLDQFDASCRRRNDVLRRRIQDAEAAQDNIQLFELLRKKQIEARKRQSI